jgi:8-oxo-dGTP pyrophosphatase MutT (NUDIX family)
MNPLLRLAYQLYQLKLRILRPITLGVRIMLIDRGRIVLVRHTYQEGWQFPGGGMKRGETTAEAARREAMEETGARLLRDPVLFGIYTHLAEGKSDHIALFLSEDFVLEQPTDRWEIAACELFDLRALPDGLSSGYRRRIGEYFAGDSPYVGRW